MKKPAKPLRAGGLDMDGLKQVQGGRGVIRGYVECLDCSATTPEPWGSCPNCGAAFNPATGGYGGGGFQSVVSELS